MRSLIALFIPPVVFLIWRKLRPVFTFVLPKSQITDYKDPRLIEHVVKRTIAASTIIFHDRKISLDSFRVFFALAMSSEKPSTIVDLGGAGGYHYFNAKIAYKNSSPRWAVVETAEFCNYAKQISELQEIYFTSSVIEAFRRFDNDVDLFYCSRALQYLPNPLETLREACSLRPKYIFLTGLALSPSGEGERIRQYSTLASNGPQSDRSETKKIVVEYELELLSKSTIEKIISPDYVILYNTVEEPRVHKLRSLDIPYTGVYAIRRDLYSQATTVKTKPNSGQNC